MTLRSLPAVVAFAVLVVSITGCEVLDSIRAPRAAQGPARPSAASLNYPELGEVQTPAVRLVELPNGLVLMLVEDRRLPLVRARARVGAGSLLDPADHVGLASVAATAMRSGGAGTLTADSLNLALESVGASIEAFAGDDATTVSMRTLDESLTTVLPLFAAVLRVPRFEADPVALAKRQQRGTIARRNDNPQGVATRELIQALYGADSPYARQPEYWTVDAIDRGDLAAWHDAHVVPANTSIAVWGDFDTETMIAQLTDAFGDWEAPAGWTSTPMPDVPEASAEPRVLFVDRPEVNQSTVLVGHLGSVRYDDPDYPALVMLNEILGGGFSGRLMRTVRTDLGLAYSVFGVYGAGYARPSVFYSGTNTKSASTIQAARAMLDVIRGMQTAPPTDGELRLARDAYLNSFVFNYDTRAEVLGRQQTYAAYGYPASFLETLRDRVLAVTPADVQRVAQTYLRPDAATVLVLGNAAEFDEPVAALGAVDTVDVTIPLTPDGGAPVAGDAEGGRAALDAVADALGGAAAFDALRTLRTVGETRATVNGTDVTIGSTVSIGFPDRLRVEQRLPTAEVTVVLDGEAAAIVTPVGRQPAPPAIVEQIRAQQYLSLPVLLAHRATLSTERMPSAEGVVVHVRVPGVEAPYVLTVGPDGRPVQIATTQVTQAGPAEVVVWMEDYRPVGGLMLPFRYRQTANGEPSGTTQLSAVEVNPTLGAEVFRVDD